MSTTIQHQPISLAFFSGQSNLLGLAQNCPSGTSMVVSCYHKQKCISFTRSLVKLIISVGNGNALFFFVVTSNHTSTKSQTLRFILQRDKMLPDQSLIVDREKERSNEIILSQFVRKRQRTHTSTSLRCISNKTLAVARS